MTKEILKVKIHQPNAHYRIPFSYRRRFTYPLPPYSTIKGLVCNLMGIRDSGDERLKKLKDGLSLAVYSRYESIVKEYIWFRNIERESHREKFGSTQNRFIDFTPQHPGGQMPGKIDVLHNVSLTIYFYHPDKDFLLSIKNAFEDPKDRNSVIHLGRAEDWIILEEIKFPLKLRESSLVNIRYFTWIPEERFVNKDFIIDDKKYDDFFKSINGNIFLLPTFYQINNNQRVFNEYAKVKLYEGGGFKRSNFYIDEEENIPLIFSRLRSN